MTSLFTRAPAAVPSAITPASPVRPSLLAVVRRVSISLLIACAIPGALFYVCVVTLGVWPAILAALLWSYGAIAWRALTSRRASGLLALTAIVMTGRTVAAVVSDSTWLYFLQPIISDGVIAVAFLASLATARPMVARLAGDFYPMNHELSLRPRIRRLFWHLTVLWAVLCVSKAVMVLWMLQSLSLESFVLVKGASVLTLNVVAAATTIGAAAIVARKEGLLGHVPAQALVPVRV